MDLLNVYEEIKKVLEIEKQMKENLKEIENQIKEEYAMIKGYKNKKGEFAKNMVKFSEVKNAGKKIFYNDNSFEIKIANYEQYKTDIKNGEENFPVSKLKKYFEVEEEKKNLKELLKDIEERATSIEELEIDQKKFSALLKLVKDEINKKDKDKLPIEEIKNKIESLKQQKRN